MCGVDGEEIPEKELEREETRGGGSRGGGIPPEVGAPPGKD